MATSVPELPMDIINEILILKDNHEQAMHFKRVSKELPLSAMFTKIKFLGNLYHISLQTGEYDAFEDIILNNMSKCEREQMIILLNTCKCCDRHQVNRPTYTHYKNGLIPHYSLSTSDSKCKCPCRHICRFICRADNDEITL